MAAAPFPFSIASVRGYSQGAPAFFHHTGPNGSCPDCYRGSGLPYMAAAARPSIKRTMPGTRILFHIFQLLMIAVLLGSLSPLTKVFGYPSVMVFHSVNAFHHHPTRNPRSHRISHRRCAP
jgi:hypothetical protein